MYSRKPGLITRVVLPVVWSLLSQNASGHIVQGRANMPETLTKLCGCIYQCLGDVFLQEASSQGARVSQKLESILQ